ncbi:MAG: 3-oxoacyl-[acyl-carrier-protein] reductase [Lachnospiraceae bacterium]|nr:3-oxoacyl-[acyl-carrier-protein] reductase [Candidatus Colinaster scatohippi]
MSNYNLNDKVALVTGASRGIGRQIAIKLAKCGATVIVNYCGSKEKADEVVEIITSNGGKAEAMQCDVAVYSETEQLIAAVLDKYGRVDILVNNAGVTRDNLLIKMSEQDFDLVIATNLKGAFNTIKHLYRNFIKLRAGKIINISSVSGVMGNAGQANYSASKAGIIGLTKSMARELSSRNVCVNAVAPGFVETDMTEKMPEAVLENAKKAIPLQRLGKAEDIANVVAFLASDSADYITGQVICVDGGMQM